MNFIKFRDAVAAQLDKMYKKDELFSVNVSKDDLWTTYLNAFPQGTNPMYLERTEHDCNCCKGFIRQVGNVIAISGTKVITPWDIEVDGEYQVVADAMAELVRKAPISNVFRADFAKIGAKENYQTLADQSIKTWNHFHTVIAPKFVMRYAGSFLSNAQSDFGVLRRSLTEITDDAVQIVLDLIADNAIYRGQEHKAIVTKLKSLKNQYKKLKNDRAREVFLWDTAVKMKAAGRIRNTVIGTLLVDISEGVDLDRAVASFETKVAPQNYKRTSAVVTKGMIDAAKKKVAELGVEDSLHRRYANERDISINNVLFADESVRTNMADSNVFDELLTPKVKDNLPNSDRIEEVFVETFLKDILPNVNSIELMMENRFEKNLMSVIAPVNAEAPNILKWGNNFSWSYNGDVTDSVKERVKQAGGNVEGEVRVSLYWYDTSDLDLHMQTPDGEIYFGRKHVGTGELDVDMNVSNPVTNAVENIAFPKVSSMKDGTYKVFVNNYYKRGSGGGFGLDVEIQGTVHTFTYEPVVRDSQNVDVCEIIVKNGEATIKPILPSSQQQKEVWGVSTQKFHKVSMVMNSPNHWDGQEIGNKHVFFILDGCENPDDARGLYNEFLSNDLNPHRKVFEMLGANLRAKHTNDQLSGVGFSTTKQDSVTLRVKGSYNRTIKVVF